MRYQTRLVSLARDPIMLVARRPLLPLRLLLLLLLLTATSAAVASGEGPSARRPPRNPSCVRVPLARHRSMPRGPPLWHCLALHAPLAPQRAVSAPVMGAPDGKLCIPTQVSPRWMLPRHSSRSTIQT